MEKELSADYFARYDESDDAHFYVYPRLTAHIDDAAQKAVAQIFREELPAQGHVLDLMSSYISHIPSDLALSGLVGLGLNEEELRNNRQLTDYLIHDLNREPQLPFNDESFDGALCTVSVQYLTNPVVVFREVGRVLRPGAPFIVSFSNRCFPSKAVKIWVATNDAQHLGLVKTFFELSGAFDHVRCLDRSPHRWLSDPLYAVVGRRVSAAVQTAEG
ncbi:MAG: methyltransferase domain-containing protein [Oscillochloris sp.]|nr:methyltransferase domain-containing protein [Oscillochloris sp.]